MRTVPFLFILILVHTAARGAPVSRTVEYAHDTASLQGVFITDPAAKGKRPGIVLFTDWMGVSDAAKAQAEKIAALGYAVFVADIYGKGRNPKDAKEAGALAGVYKSNRPLMRRRAAAGLAQLKSQAGVDTARIAAMGYCFGGTVALELARSGADLDGAASVHGNLDTPDPAKAARIKGTVLVLHGANDPFVPAEQVRNFQEEMRAAGADWYMITFGNAVHSFTHPGAGSDPSDGSAYNAKADARALEALKDFYAGIFGAGVTRK